MIHEADGRKGGEQASSRATLANRTCERADD